MEYLQDSHTHGHNILKNHTLKNIISSSPSTQIGLVFVVMLMMTTLLSSSVGALQRNHSDTNSNNAVIKKTAPDSVFTANNYLPYLIKIVDKDSVLFIPTTHINADHIMQAAGIKLAPEDEYVFEQNDDIINNPLVGYNLVINRATPVFLNIHGVASKINTQSITVGALLQSMDVAIKQTDVVSPSPQSKITTNMKISLVRVGTETISLEETVPFETIYVDNSDLAYNTKKIKTAGVNGKAKNTYRVTYHDNAEVSRIKQSSVMLQKPVNEIVIRGTQGAPTSGGPLSAAQIHFLGHCESGMTATRNNGNGYYGAFQFSAGTWNSMGTGYARADLAPLDVQIQAVQRLLARSSIFGQFPGCANRMKAAGIL